MGTIKMIPSGKPLKEQTLHINRYHHKIRATVMWIQYRDKDTRQIVIYIPSLEISGYGATVKKATDMIKFSMDEYFTFLVKLSTKEMLKELSKHGWQHKSKYNNKEYSKAYIDSDGKLQNFNAVADKVEVGVLSY